MIPQKCCREIHARGLKVREGKSVLAGMLSLGVTLCCIMKVNNAAVENMDCEYHWVYCPDCNMTLVFESWVERGGEGVEQVICPQCGRELAGIRADDGCDCIGVACGYLYPGKPCCGGGY